MPRSVAFLTILLLAACAGSGPSTADVATPQASATVVLVNGTPLPSSTPTSTPSPTPANIPDLAGQSIVFFHLCDRSGPFASADASRIQAVEDMTAAINAEGGIFGATLDVQFADTEGTADGALSALARLIRLNGEPPLALLCDPVAESALVAQLTEDEIPALAPGISVAESGFMFPFDAAPQKHFAFFLEDLRANWDARKPDGAGDEIRVALITWPPELAGSLSGEAIDVDLGTEIVMEASLPAEHEANVFHAIYEARDENANVIFTNARGYGLAALLNALHDLGLRERFVVAAPAAAFDAQVYENLADPSYADGLYLTSAWAWWSEEDNPGIQDLLAQAEAQRNWDAIEMAGAVALARHALEEAILAEGFAALGPESVTAALENIEEYPVFGGLFVVDYGASQPSVGPLRAWQVGAEPWLLTVAE